MKKKLPLISPTVARLPGEIYAFRLYISGASTLSARAVENLKEICKEHLLNRHTLEIIDVRQKPEAARQEQMVVLPLLVKKTPLPERRLIGDLADRSKVLIALGLK